MIQSNETIKEIPTKKKINNNKKEKNDRHNDPHLKKENNVGIFFRVMLTSALRTLVKNSV